VFALACVPLKTFRDPLKDTTRPVFVLRGVRERSRAGWTYTGRPRVILSLLPEEPRPRLEAILTV
jgi:hypothetical protein